MESFSKCLAVILAILLLILAPVRALAHIQESRESEWYENRVREFAQETKRFGYLDRSRYERFCRDIGNLGALWEIELFHAREKAGIQDGAGIAESPEGRMARLSSGTSSGSHTHTADCYTHTHTELTDDSRGRYYCTHTHTSDCKSGGWSRIHMTSCAFCNLNIEMYQFNYNQNGQLIGSIPLYIPPGSRCPVCERGLSGQRYSWRFYYSCGFSVSTVTDSASVPSSMKTPEPGTVQSGWFREPLDGYAFGCYRYSMHNHEAEQCEHYLRRRTIPIVCKRCTGIVGALTYEYDSDHRMTGSYRPDRVFVCCGAGSEADPARSIEEYTYLCGLESGWELICGKEIEAVTPVCDRVMIAIHPLVPNQTIYVGEEPDTSVVVDCLSGGSYTDRADTDFSADAPGTYEAVLYLEGYADTARIQGRKSAVIRIEVLAREKECGNGHTYRLEADGSDPGCPICRVTPESLEVLLEKTVIYQGEGIPIQSVTVTYLDGHAQQLSGGYEVIYDASAVGDVNVAVSYGGIRQTVSVLVKPNLTGLSVLPARQNIVKYEEPGFLVTALYGDGSSAVISDYELEGIRTDQAGVQNGRIRYQENGKEALYEVVVNVLPLSATCAYGHLYDRDADDVSWGCPICFGTLTALEAAPSPVYGRIGDLLEITVIALYQDGHTEEISDYESSYDAFRKGKQEVTIRYQGLEAGVEVILEEYMICPFCGREIRADEECGYCGRLPVRLLAEPPQQTILLHEEPEFVVYAEYQNGYRERVIGYRNTFRKGVEGTQTVEIFYGGLSTAVVVTVEDTGQSVCPVCGGEYDRDEGEVCPYCSRELVRIEAEPEGGRVIRRGTDLKARVILFYRAGNQEVVYSGYTVKNYDPMKIGIQGVEIWYREMKAELMIEVAEISDEMECEQGHLYDRNPDGTDPGCPYCLSRKEEQTKDYLDIYYTPQILEVLEREGSYPLQSGDYFGIRLVKKDGSFAERLITFLWGAQAGDRQIRYSIMIGEGEEQNGGI